MNSLQIIVDYLWLVRTHRVVLANQEGGIIHSTVSAYNHLMSDALLLVQRVQAELDILPALQTGNHDLVLLLLFLFYFVLLLLPVCLPFNHNHRSGCLRFSLFANTGTAQIFALFSLVALAHELVDCEHFAVDQVVTLWTFAQLLFLLMHSSVLSNK